MKIHVLPGDALAEEFKNSEIEADETVICRECLIEGAIDGDDLESFWTTRAQFIRATYDEPEISYRRKVVGEFERLRNLKSDDAVYLWFEHDLFCQANMWFCLSLLSESDAAIYRVAPVVRREEEIWNGFGKFNARDLRECFARKIEFDEKAIRLAADLWSAYQKNDYEKLETLGKSKSECFSHLEEVCRAEIEKRTRPRRALKEIISAGETDFARVFESFSRREGIYGFGDAQLKNICDALEK